MNVDADGKIRLINQHTCDEHVNRRQARGVLKKAINEPRAKKNSNENIYIMMP